MWMWYDDDDDDLIVMIVMIVMSVMSVISVMSVMSVMIVVEERDTKADFCFLVKVVLQHSLRYDCSPN